MGTVPAVASFRKLSAAMKCLVQGGAGFIGSNLVDGLRTILAELAPTGG